VRTSVFDTIRGINWPEGYSGRAIANDFSRRWHGNETDLANNAERESEGFWAAMKAGDVSKAVVFAGEGLDLIHDIKPAGEIVAQMVGEAERLLRNPLSR
jgi:nitronate monooxygenase